MATPVNSPAGIRACFEGAPAPEFYRFNSRWDGTVAGQRVTVFAGCLAGTPSQGVMLVRTLPLDKARRGRHIARPAGCGSLRLIGWSGGRRKVLAENGDAVWVDVPAAAVRARAKVA